MKKTAELKVLPISVLKPAEYNPRKKLKPGDREYKKIKDSIEEFGFADPLVVNADMTIIGGHQRLNVAVDLGYTEVPCAVVDVAIPCWMINRRHIGRTFLWGCRHRVGPILL